MENLLKDIRLAWRKIRNRPAASLVIILSLGLAIGANTSVFSFLDTVLLSGLPFDDPDDLVRLREARVEEGEVVPIAVAPATYAVLQEGTEAFTDLAAHEPAVFSLTGDGEPQNLRGGRITWNFLSVLGVRPVLGRDLAPEDDRPGGAAPVVLISHGLWQRRFDASPDILGKTLLLDQQAREVIGVLPPRFKFPYDAELWVPMGLDVLGSERPYRLYLNVFARRAPGFSLERAQSAMTALGESLQERDPEHYDSLTIHLESVRDDMIGDVRPGLLALFAAAGFVLLIATVNAASLLLAQAVEETNSLSIRVAMGAGRGRLIRQLLTHSGLLGLMAGAVGLLLALWTLEPLARLSPVQDLDVYFRESLEIDTGVFAFTLLVSLGVGLVFGLLPAWAASRPSLQGLLSEGGRSVAGARTQRWLTALVLCETALAVVLLAAAGLTLKSFQQLQSVELGFESENLLAVRLVLPDSRYPERQQRVAFYDQLLERLRALPGVAAAGITTNHGHTGEDHQAPFFIEDRPPENPGDFQLTNHRVISPDYFKTMGIPLLAGRSFDQDRQGTEPVVVVSKHFADTHLGPDPLGKRVRPRAEGYPWLTVVGVVGDIEEEGDYRETWYVPHHQEWGFPDLYLMVRASGDDPMSQAGAIRQLVWSIDRDQPVDEIRTVHDLVADSLRQERFSSLLYSLFGGLALLVAAVGIYGIISYAVSRRFREFGIRLALGARPRDLRRLVLRQALALTLGGLLVGTLAAFALTRYLSSLLYEVSPTDPAVFGGVIAGLVAVALAASYLPARKASRVDPVEALAEL